MKVTAAVLNAPNTALSLEELELDAPRAGEVRVRLVATGLCHTDLSVMGRPFPVPQPMVLGHEGAGVVESVGPGVTKVNAGDRVILSYNFCGDCALCRREAPSYCQYFFGRNFLGQRPDGSTALRRGAEAVRHNFFGQSSLATACLCTERNVVRVPDEVPDALFEWLGPLGCGIQTGAGAVMNVLKPARGDAFVVFGSGAVGMAGLMAARVMEAGVLIAVDRVPERLALARELGATHTLLADGSVDVVARIREITGGGAHCSLDTTAVSAVLRQALDCLAPLGRCGFVGGAPVGTTLEVDVRDMMLHGKTLRGIVEGDADADTFIPALLRLQAQGLFPFERLMKAYPLSELATAVADAKSGKTVKPVLRMPPHE